jgi:hypothetical protein
VSLKAIPVVIRRAINGVASPIASSSRDGRFYLILVGVVLASCSDPLDVDFGPGPLFQTDASTYVVSQRDNVLEVSIPFRFENRLPQAIYLQKCPGALPPILERKVGDTWSTEWIESDLCTGNAVLVIAPGASYADTVRIHAHPFGGDRKPQFKSSDVTGVHRLQWSRALRSFDTDSKPPIGEQLPLRHRISNEFQLKGP